MRVESNADRQLADILRRLKPTTAKPRLSEGELMDMVVREIRKLRAGRKHMRPGRDSPSFDTH